MVKPGAILFVLVLCAGLVCAQDQVPAASSTNQPSPSPGAAAGGDSCTPEKPLATNEESIHVHLWAAETHASDYAWAATAGRIEGHGIEALWNLSGAPEGYATATVQYTGAAGPTSCSLRIIVEKPAGNRGAALAGGLAGVHSHALLVKNKPEAAGYGLYSYVLLTAAPDDSSRPRCLQLMQAILDQAPAVEALGQYFDPKQLNATYIPVTSPPLIHYESAQWLLDNYDYAHASFLLHAVPGNLSRGPYLVSSLQPLSKAPSGPFLVQDLSSVPPHLVSLWTNEFLNQAAQEHFWEQSMGTMFALRLRTAIGIMAEGLPDVRKSLSEWISVSK